MGSDDLYHKRKARKNASLKRESARQKSYDVMLIVCEGSKTEPNYFSELREDLRLSSAYVDIVGDGVGSAPINVVEYGFEKYLDYDIVFCVFDKDRHSS